MKAKRQKNWIRRAGFLLVLFGLVPALFKGFIASIPLVTAAAERAVFWSFGLTMPEGMLVLSDEIDEKGRGQAMQETEDDTPDRSEGNGQTQLSDPNTQILQRPVKDAQPYEPTATDRDGPIVRETFKAGTTSAFIPIGNNAYIQNTTSVSSAAILSEIQKPPAFTIESGTEPQVLIMHTHTTESYEDASRDFYDESYNSRTTDNTKNMVRVGDEIEMQLKMAGIGVIHDKTLHDYPSYNGSYDRSRVTVEKILEEYPSIQVVLDIHRDAIQRENGERVAPVVEVNGKNAAQMMIISCCDDGSGEIPNYMENLRFACALQRQMEGDYPGLTRPILFSCRHYNQDLTSGSILVEVGAHGNSLDEAVYAGELLGKSLVKLLNGMKN
ncbi:MAG TPA: stage II sporulation protein P [Firmicutes bacterium]|nr:stage II sporulation protein P [Bacillota bacterium]